MNLSDLLQILQTARGYSLTTEQADIIGHPNGPGWVLAGPGTGKTEILTIMLLRLLYVDNDTIQGDRVPPESIFVTTFTEKAARNLEDRLATMRAFVIAADSSLEAIDISKLRINTLHGLCNELLQEYRAPNYQNVRLMDDFEQGMFIHEHMDMVKRPVNARDVPFWTEFEFLFEPRVWKSSYNNCPRKWAMAKTLVKIFNRLVEDRIDIAALRAAGGQKERLADLYDEYNQILQDNFRCDFSHLQARFLEFLGTPVGQAFCDGTDANSPGIQWVLVDEYQDTNRIQEEIYLTLANRGNRNLVVVGDDDQALYRFRGGSVECMVTFDNAVQVFMGIPSSSVTQYPLSVNFRSHPQVVSFCDEYITSFSEMRQPGARVPGKPSLSAGSVITGGYPAVATLEAARVRDLHSRFAEMVKGLIDNGIVSDPNQCCLLLKSTKETPRNAGPYVEALQDEGLAVYNPRNKAFLTQEEIQCLLGAILTIVDNDRTHEPTIQNGPRTGQMIYPLVEECREAFETAVSSYDALRNYVERVVNAVKAAKAGVYFDSNLHEIVYLLIGLEPFRSWQTDPVRRFRIGQLTKLIEAFSSMPVPGYPNVSRGTLRISQRNPGEIIPAWVGQFYHLFIGYLNEAGLDDIEDDEVICPAGMVPIMTMHQAKGLEFPFVFVGHAGETAKPSDTHQLEEYFDPYPTNSARAFSRASANERATLDMIRQYFVAYSRAQYAVIIVGSKNQIRQKVTIPCGPTKNWLTRRSINL
jgi:DNA helicase-2/ATP-dependent DNA helicase PcrA